MGRVAHDAVCVAQNANATVSCGAFTTAQAIQGLLARTDAQRVLDITYGSGLCWTGHPGIVIGCDRNFVRAKSVQCDFTALPFCDNAIDAVVFDPPFHPNVGTIYDTKFSTLGRNEKELRDLFMQGCREAWRVSNKWVIVKCQNYIHNHKPQWMVLWAIDALGAPFEWLTSLTGQKSLVAAGSGNCPCDTMTLHIYCFAKREIIDEHP